MSLKTFLSKLFGGLKKELKALPLQVRNGIHIGITVVEGIKKVLDSPVVDVFTTLFPGDVDNKIINVLRDKLPRILAEMKLVEACAGETDPAKLVECAAREIGKLTGTAKMNFTDSLAVMIAEEFAKDGNVTASDLKYLVKPYYDLIYKPKK
jgi:hypothetical protein